MDRLSGNKVKNGSAVRGIDASVKQRSRDIRPYKVALILQGFDKDKKLQSITKKEKRKQLLIFFKKTNNTFYL